MSIFKLIMIVIVLIVAAVFFTLQRNGANLFESPGMTKRLGIFFSTNLAATSDNPHFEELRTPVFDLPANELYQRVLDAGSELGWGIIGHDKDNQHVNFVVRSPVFLYEDDLVVQVMFVKTDKSSLHIQSSSRSGKGDLAANSGHIQKLIKKLKM